jgi:folate-binding protein YgfZ
VSDYETLVQGCGLLDRSERGKLLVSGRDGAQFLDSLLSNDIASIETGGGAWATLLTPKGRMLAEVRVLHTEEGFWLDTDRVSLQALFDALHTYRIGYRADLHKRTLECCLLSLIGPQADAVLEGPAPAENSTRSAELARTPVTVVRTENGIDVIGPSAATEALRAELEHMGAAAVSEEAAECLRVERGRPRFGIDLDERTMPQEAGIHERVVSYAKGCYVGQETVARLYWKGKPNRNLRGLRLSEPAPPGTPLRRGELEAGALGTVAVSPRFGPIALALLRREVEPGEELSLEGARAIVVELPFAQ